MKPLVSVLLLVIVLQGCSSARGIWPVGQSRVLYPTTTIIPIGEARGEASDYFFTYGGVVDLMHPDIAEVAVQDAIKSKGGDLLIDYTL